MYNFLGHLFFVTYAISAAIADSAPIVITTPIGAGFLAKTAENYTEKTAGDNAPRILQTSPDEAAHLFCKKGPHSPNILATHIRLSQDDMDQCKKAGVYEITEVQLGYGAVAVIASPDLRIDTLRPAEIYAAVTRALPMRGKMAMNPYKNWNEINPILPAVPIRVFGPAYGGTGWEVFLQNVLIAGGEMFPGVAPLKQLDPQRYSEMCMRTRNDGHFMEIPERVIKGGILKLKKLMAAEKGAILILPIKYIRHDLDPQKIMPINGVIPTDESISNGTYELSRPLLLYAKKGGVGHLGNHRDFAMHILSHHNGAMALLSDMGFVPLINEGISHQFNVLLGGDKKPLPDEVLKIRSQSNLGYGPRTDLADYGDAFKDTSILNNPEKLDWPTTTPVVFHDSTVLLEEKPLAYEAAPELDEKHTYERTHFMGVPTKKEVISDEDFDVPAEEAVNSSAMQVRETNFKGRDLSRPSVGGGAQDFEDAFERSADEPAAEHITVRPLEPRELTR